MSRSLAGRQNLASEARNLHQILQNLLCPQNLKSGFSAEQSMTWKVISRFRKVLCKICSEIWISLSRSISWSRFQISEYSPLKGEGGLPAKRGRHTTFPEGIRSRIKSGSDPSPTTAARTAKHMTAVVFHPSSPTTKERPLMADLTLPSAVAGASPEPCPPPETGRGILALDLATTTGWALRNADGLITSGTVSFRPSRFDGGGMRYLRFTSWLAEIDRLSGPIAAIWFEEVRRHAATDAAHVFGGLLATLTAWAELRGIAYSGVPVGTIKKFATGKGNAPKDAMIAAVKTRGFSPSDDNEADAIALLLWVIDTHGGLA